MYDSLRQDHVDLLEVAREIRSRIAHDTLIDSVGLAQCRWRLARTVTQHLAMEDVHLYARLANDPRPEAVAISARFERELKPLLGAFNAHIVEWTADAVRKDWDGYRVNMAGLLDALEARIECEEAELYPLLAAVARHAA